VDSAALVVIVQRCNVDGKIESSIINAAYPKQHFESSERKTAFSTPTNYTQNTPKWREQMRGAKETRKGQKGGREK
jgi:hypothetical protein